jgi:ATP-dependent Lon protease
MNKIHLLEINELNNYISSSKDDSADSGEQIEIPEIISILPIRNAVAYPGTVMPLSIGRKRSKTLIEEVSSQNSIIGLITQINPDTDHPTPGQLYKVGTIASILKTIKMPQNMLHIIVHCQCRFKIVQIISTEPYIKAKIQPLYSHARITKTLKAMMVNVRQTANKVISLSPNVSEEASVLLENIENPSALADFIAANLTIELSAKQKLLEELNAQKRLERVQVELTNQLEVLELSQKIQGQVRESIDKTQREYFLQEQLKAIQDELGVNDKKSEETQKILLAIKKAKMPATVEAEAKRELDRMAKMHPSSPEYSVIRTYLDWVCELPWSVSTKDSLSIESSQKILNHDHYGLDKIKKRILEFLAVRKLNPTGKSPILCFVGPPGVGKTSLGKSIAKAMNRKFVRISLGGIRDEADIRGHRRTYIGALPGRIMQELRKCGSRNPVFMLDELDKIGADFRGDPASALLEVLDPEQNDTFTDHYLDQPFDLSNVMFIGTANYAEPIPAALYDRMEIIELPGYTEKEKTQIAKKYLIPRQLSENGLKKKNVTIKDAAIAELINSYTSEAGVRNLERNIAAICRSVATKIAKGSRRSAVVDKNDLAKILGPIKFESEIAMRAGTPGVATALAWTPAGGEILFIETAKSPGEGGLKLTGQIGDVMKESAEAAFTVIKSSAAKMGIKKETIKENDFHIHVPEGAVPKDGPSAGIAIFTSVASLLLKRPVKPNVAMTGEITLRELVLPIGGLKEKILAAKRAGIKTVILPYRNKKDMVEVPKEAKSGLKFIFVNKASEVLKAALEPQA